MAVITDRVPPNGKLILITGARGFIGSHIVAAFLERGYSVRAAVRSQASAGGVFNTHRRYIDRLSVCVVPDITVDGAFDTAVTGVDGIIHTASPFNFTAKTTAEILDPAIRGTESLLSSAKRRSPNVHRIVKTSSLGAIIDYAQGIRPGHTYTEADWNPIDLDTITIDDPIPLYLASKTFAEKAAWEFMNTQRPDFTLSTICPGLTYGPVIHTVESPSALNTSMVDFHRLMSGASDSVPQQTPISCVFADVRDVAKLHLLAFESPKAAGQRYLAVNGVYSYQQVVDIMRSEVMSARKKAPVGLPGAMGPEGYRVSNAKSKRELGMVFRPLADTVIDTSHSLLRLEEETAERQRQEIQPEAIAA